MKKFFYLLFSAIFLVFCTFSLTGCKKDELKKVSKNLTSYAISAKLDDEKKEISGTETIVFYNSTGEELDNVCLHLYPRAFRENATIKPYTKLTLATCFPSGVSYGDISIIDVKVNGEIKKHELTGEDEDVLKINFGFKLSNKKSIKIVINFIITIPSSTHRFGYYDGNINLGNWYPIICKYSSDGFDFSPYYATGDPFFSDIANYNVKFEFPEKYKYASTGEFSSSKSDGTIKVEAKALAVRDFAICLSEKSDIISTKTGKTTINYMGYSKDTEKEKYLAISKDAIEYFSKTFGEYPYSSMTVVKTPFIYGGMEYPNLVMISDSIDDEDEFLKVIVHEIAHQWWYGIVGNNEVSEAWLDESLSEYSTAMFFGKYNKYNISYDDFVSNALSSYMLYVDVISTIRGDVITKMNLPVNEYQNDYEYSYMVYVKGVIMFDSLKSMVGEKKLVAGFKRYYENNKFKVASKDDFYKAFSEACHKDLNNFFEGFLNGTTIISNIS